MEKRRKKGLIKLDLESEKLLSFVSRFWYVFVVSYVNVIQNDHVLISLLGLQTAPEWP